MILENFKENKRELDKELERFVMLLNQLLPHYHALLKKKELKEISEKKKAIQNIKKEEKEDKEGKYFEDGSLKPYVNIISQYFSAGKSPVFPLAPKSFNDSSSS